MNNNKLLEPNLARLIDILEQIKALNKIIALHKNNFGDSFMINQYQDRKNRFLEELKDIFSDYEIDVLLKNKVA